VRGLASLPVEDRYPLETKLRASKITPTTEGCRAYRLGYSDGLRVAGCTEQTVRARVAGLDAPRAA